MSSLRQRLRDAFLKPAETLDVPPPSLADPEEMAKAARSADDKERLIGLVAAPLAAAIAFIVNAAAVAHDPPPLLADGQPDMLHVAYSLYDELLGVMLVLSVLMVVFAWLRRRLYLGIVLALDGLALFNLHYWGFALPFLMVGAWLLVRSYRLQRAFRQATARAPGARAAVAPSSKRYTPPASAARRSAARTRSRP